LPTPPPELTIRRAREQDLPEMARLHYAAFPGVPMTLDERINYLKHDPRLTLEDHWVCENKGRLAGMFALYKFTIQRGRISLRAGGIGMVAVAPEARRQKIAYWMMLRAVEVMDQNDMPVSILYPFNHTFYRRLGWGSIGRTTLYRFPPGSLPDSPGRKSVSPVTTYQEQSEVMDCYLKFSEGSNGLLQRDEPIWFERIFKNNQCFLYRGEKGAAEGYVTFSYHPLPPEEHLIAADIHIKEVVFLTDEALRGLLGFLAAQSDQARAVLYPDQFDLNFEISLVEPRMEGGRHNWILGAEAASIGVGLMGRIVNLRKAIASGRLGGATGRVTFDIRDDLNPANAEPLTVEFEGGKISFPKGGGKGITLRCDVAIFASLFWGALKFSEARRLGLVEYEGEGDPAIFHRLFNLPKPVCYDYF